MNNIIICVPDVVRELIDDQEDWPYRKTRGLKYGGTVSVDDCGKVIATFFSKIIRTNYILINVTVTDIAICSISTFLQHLGLKHCQILHKRISYTYARKTPSEVHALTINKDESTHLIITCLTFEKAL